MNSPPLYAIKWIEAEDGTHLTCWIAPTKEVEPTDNWRLLMQVSLPMVNEDEELFPALVEVINNWTIKFFERQGVTVIKMVQFPGGFTGTTLGGDN